ncbi:similar to Saccharomyces cerevisiae YML029W USA1 Scaffold subunit of the Hrd1p ubiquitin ligase that also promotes ligase oligomerization [Maudiozyma saulgeensis]|uniref:Similar to Saccharomyces cerevisiae YML029W USA1 Scaffold subunit of the Hrd1p ubiquitin ligase that also promotes ligase oligomerization n=1 Tax=Maudiozyma saulgeensis TaxID=1789683 RepID=A0A1X7QWP1_9SACH|nr:similar to Saccharomyces cerevisiae YML029W USA1 Scaffold subunit of the Hrd1p ubiquitin ligase that also promotes ligase oligomerization [Kazachstania saulgeensis]
MFELKVEKPLNVSIYSSNLELINSNLIVAVHPKTTILRLLQYVHYQLSLNHYENNSIQLEDVAAYCLKLEEQTVPLESSIESLITDNTLSHISMSFELSEAKSFSALNLQYDPVTDFGITNIKYEVNILSKYKFLHNIEYQIPLDTKVSRLEKSALEHLIYEEQFLNHDNKCHLGHEHTVESLVALKLNGESDVIQLTEETRYFYMDLTLKDLLHIDFAPLKDNVFTIMVYAKHEQNIADLQDIHMIELISNSKLFQKYMLLDSRTSVGEVRQFVCDVYSASQTISPKDVKLIYKGQLVHDKNFAENDARILSCIDMRHGAQLHVQVTEQQTYGLTDSFWNEPGLVDDVPNQVHQNNTPISSVNEIPGLDTPIAININEETKPHFVTESGRPINVSSDMIATYGDYIEGSLEDGYGNSEEVLVSADILNKTQGNILIGDHLEVNVSTDGQDYIIDRKQNVLRINPQTIEQIESLTGNSIMYHGVTNKFPQVDNDSNSGLSTRIRELLNNELNDPEILQRMELLFNRQTSLQRFQGLSIGQKIIFSVKKLFQFLKVCSLTVVYLIWYMFLPIAATIEVGFFLPPFLTISILIVYTIVMFFRSNKIIDMWTDFLELLILNEEDYKRVKLFVLPEYTSIRTLRHEDQVNSSPMPKKVYEKIQEKPSLYSLFLLSALDDVRHSLYDQYQINQMGNMTEDDSLKELFRQIKTGAVEISDANRMLEILFMIHELQAFENKQQENDFYRVLAIIKQQADLQNLEAVEPVRRSIIIVRRRAEELPNLIAEYIVPDPLRDDYVMAVTKNIVLCLVLFLPFSSRYVDVVIQRRVDERTRERLQRAREDQEHDFEQVNSDHDNTTINNGEDSEGITELDPAVIEEIAPERGELDSIGDLSPEEEIIEDILTNGDEGDDIVNATGAMFHTQS